MRFEREVSVLLEGVFVRQDEAMIKHQALDWVIRLRDPAFADWEAFEAWLGADAAHADTYQAMAVADQDVAALLATVPEDAAAPATTNRRYWLGGAIAASLAASIVGVIAYNGMTGLQPSLYQVETAPGVRRLVALADGSSVTLNGDTRLTFDRNDPRMATLDRGEALFTVVHDEVHPFRVAVGAATLVDVGTRFNVVRSGEITTVQVSEGAVVYNPEGEAVHLGAGRRLRAVDGDPTLIVGKVDIAAVAGWKEGRLIYDGQPLRDVAADLSRYYGQPVRVDPAIAGRAYHGVLSLDADGNLSRLGLVLDAQVSRSGGGWVLSAR